MKPRAPRRQRTLEELAHAVTLRPADVYTLYGIIPMTLHNLCTNGDEFGVLPSILIGAKSGPQRYPPRAAR